MKLFIFFVLCDVCVHSVFGHPGGDYPAARNLCPLRCGDGFKCERQSGQTRFSCVVVRYEVQPPFSPLSKLTGSSVSGENLHNVVQNAVQTLVQHASENLPAFGPGVGGHEISVSMKRVRVPLSDGHVSEEHVEGKHFTDVGGGAQTFVQNVPFVPGSSSSKSQVWSQSSFSSMPWTQLPTNQDKKPSHPDATSNTMWSFGSSLFDNFKSMLNGLDQSSMGFGEPNSLLNTGMVAKTGPLFGMGMNSGFSQPNTFKQPAGKGTPVQQQHGLPNLSEVLGTQTLVEPLGGQNLDVKQGQPTQNEMSAIDKFKKINNMGGGRANTHATKDVSVPPSVDVFANTQETVNPNLGFQQGMLGNTVNDQNRWNDQGPNNPSRSMNNFQQNNRGFNGAINNFNNQNMLIPGENQFDQSNTWMPNQQTNVPFKGTHGPLVGSQFQGSDGKGSNTVMARHPDVGAQTNQIEGALQHFRDNRSSVPWTQGNRIPVNSSDNRNRVVSPNTLSPFISKGGKQCKSCDTNDDCTAGRNHYCYYDPECAIKVCQLL